MNREQFIATIKGKTIEDIIFSDIGNDNAPFAIKGISLTDGHYLYFETKEANEIYLSINHPAYEAEVKSFSEKLANTMPSGFFIFQNNFMSHSEMDELTKSHSQKIHSNGWAAGNSPYPHQVKVSFGEDLSTL